MMGKKAVRQEELFYELSLERYVPPNHLLRAADAPWEWTDCE